MGIFERLVELARSNSTPLEHDFELDDPHDASWPTSDADPVPTPAPEIVVHWYRRLGLPAGSSLADVRSSYRRLRFEFHPDKFAGDPEKQRMATVLFRELTVAYRGLTTHLSGAR